jgi:hypothetical protein
MFAGWLKLHGRQELEQTLLPGGRFRDSSFVKCIPFHIEFAREAHTCMPKWWAGRNRLPPGIGSGYHLRTVAEKSRSHGCGRMS